MTMLLSLITARGGSKRLPGKNLRSLAGKSLLARTADALRGSAWRDSPCLLSTDDPDIRSEGLRLGWLAPWLRPPELATDAATSLDVALHALDRWKGERGSDPDVLLVLQPTSPFRGSSVIDLALDRLVRDPNVDAVIGAWVLHRSPSSIFSVAEGDRLVPLADVSAPSSLLTPNGALYAIRSPVLRSSRTFTPERTAAIAMDVVRSIDIDTPEDWMIAEAIAERVDGMLP